MLKCGFTHQKVKFAFFHNINMNKNNKEERDDQFVQELIKQHYPQSILDKSIDKTSKLKSQSVATLPSIMKNQLTVESSLNKRYNRHQKSLKRQITDLEIECNKFGGSQHIKAQMNKQKISREQQQKYYEKRMQKLHHKANIPTVNSLFKCKMPQIKQCPQKPNPYNKWYIKPQNRFSRAKSHLNLKQIKADIREYVNQLLQNEQKKQVEIKGEYAPLIIKESQKKLGRQPIICSYAKISRN